MSNLALPMAIDDPLVIQLLSSRAKKIFRTGSAGGRMSGAPFYLPAIAKPFVAAAHAANCTAGILLLY